MLKPYFVFPTLALALAPSLGHAAKVNIYGYLKTDVAYDTARLSTGDFARWVEPKGVKSSDAEMNITANQSRFGFTVTEDAGDRGTVDGRFELDFYGGGPENKSHARMRHAYAKWKSPFGVELLVGQTWDVIAPLSPSTVNFSVQWWQGNIGFRRPQIRLTKVVDAGPVAIDTRIALTRNIGRPATNGGGVRLDPGDSGEDSGLPSLQGRIGIDFNLISAEKSSLGLSGHWAKEQVDRDAAGETRSLDSWSGTVDLSLHFSPAFDFKGEVWMGQALDAYNGGIGQGVTQTGDALAGKGGWASLGWRWGPIRGNVGASMDDPEDKNLAEGARVRHSSEWANVFVPLTDRLICGAEFARLETDYKTGHSAAAAVAERGQVSFVFTL